MVEQYASISLGDPLLDDDVGVVFLVEFPGEVVGVQGAVVYVLLMYF